MTISAAGVCFRQTDAYVTNPDGHHKAPATAGSYSSAQGYGWLSSAPFQGDDDTTVPAIAGYANWNNVNYAYRWDVASGNYTARLALGRSNAMAKGLLVWDGHFGDGTFNAWATGMVVYGSGVSVGLNKFTVVEDRLYKCTEAGTTGTGTAPAHTSGTGTDGSVTWQFIKQAILWVHAASASGIIDAAANLFTGTQPAVSTAWDAGNSESAEITITQGYVTLTPDASLAGAIKYFGLTQSATPLQDAVLIDEDGFDAGDTPTLYCKEPERPVMQLNVLSGDASAASFSLLGTLTSPTYGGDVGDYYQVITHNGGVWLATTDTRLPDDATGTIVVRQTDPSSLISGSPHDTTFTPNFIPAGNRAITGREGLLSTPAWLILDRVRTMASAAWQGHESQPFNGGDAAVTSAAELQALYNTYKAAAASGQWFRIRLQEGGDWSTNISLTGDFYQDGTGGILIEPDTGHDPYITGAWTGTPMRGVHFRGLRFYCAALNGISIRGDKAAGSSLSTLSAVVISECHFGPDTWTDNVSLSTNYYPVRFFGSELLTVRDSSFYGFYNGVDAFDVRLFEFARNDMQQMQADLLGTSNSCKLLGMFATDECLVYVHDNSAHNFNTAKPVGTTLANVIHVDWNQERTTVDYSAGGTVPGAHESFVAVVGQYLAVENLYVCTQGGNTSGTRPTHTAGTASDGEAAWQWVCSIDDAPRVTKVFVNNFIDASTTDYVDSANAGDNKRFYPQPQVHIMGNFLPMDMVQFNNIYLTSIDRGISIEQDASNAAFYLEYNSFLGPTALPPNPANDPVDPFTDASFALAQNFRRANFRNVTPFNQRPCNGKNIRMRGNLLSGVMEPAGVFDGGGNTVADYRGSATAGARPDDVLKGPFNASPNADGFYMPVSPPANDGSLPMAEHKSAVSKLCHPKAGSSGGRTKEVHTLTVNGSTLTLEVLP